MAEVAPPNKGPAFILLDPAVEASDDTAAHFKNTATHANGKLLVNPEGDTLTRREYMEDNLNELLKIIYNGNDGLTKSLFLIIENTLIDELKTRQKVILKFPPFDNIGIRQHKTREYAEENPGDANKLKYIMARLPIPAIAFLIFVYRVKIKLI